jgi:hypothetical protein
MKEKGENESEDEPESKLDKKLNNILFALKSTSIRIHFRSVRFIWAQIFKAYLTNDKKILTILFYRNSLYLETYDQRGNILEPKILFENIHNLNIASLHSKERLVLLAKFKECDDYDRIFVYLLIFDESFNVLKGIKMSNTHDIISVAENDSKYYCLLKSTANSAFLSIYDSDLKEIDRKGLDAKEINDPFYFLLDTKQLRVLNGSIFILETGLIKEMNKNTGFVTKQFPVFGSSFELIQNKLVLFDDENKITLYDKSGRERKTFDLSKELKGCELSFLSKNNVMGLNV